MASAIGSRDLGAIDDERRDRGLYDDGKSLDCLVDAVGIEGADR
jgi:hypothetical protein